MFMVRVQIGPGTAKRHLRSRTAVRTDFHASRSSTVVATRSRQRASEMIEKLRCVLRRVPLTAQAKRISRTHTHRGRAHELEALLVHGALE